MRVSPIYWLAALTLSAFTSTGAINPTARHISKAQGSLPDLDNKMIRSAGLLDEKNVAVQIGPEGLPTKPDAGEEEHDHLAYVVGSNGQLQEFIHDEQFMDEALGEQRMYQTSQQAVVAPAVVAPAQPLAPVAPSVVAQAAVVAAAPTLAPVAPAVVAQPAVVAAAPTPAPVAPAVVAQPAVVQPAPTAAPAAPVGEGDNFFGWVFLIVGCFMGVSGVAILVGYIGTRFGLFENDHFKTLQEAVESASSAPATIRPASHVPGRLQSGNLSEVSQNVKPSQSKEKQTYRRSVLQQANSASDDENAEPSAACTGGSQGLFFDT